MAAVMKVLVWRKKRVQWRCNDSCGRNGGQVRMIEDRSWAAKKIKLLQEMRGGLVGVVLRCVLAAKRYGYRLIAWGNRCK